MDSAGGGAVRDRHRVGPPGLASLLKATEQQIVLARARPGMLVEIADYLFDRSTGHIGSYFSLITRGCYRAIRTGEETITREPAGQRPHRRIIRESAARAGGRDPGGGRLTSLPREAVAAPSTVTADQCWPPHAAHPRAHRHGESMHSWLEAIARRHRISRPGTAARSWPGITPDPVRPDPGNRCCQAAIHREPGRVTGREAGRCSARPVRGPGPGRARGRARPQSGLANLWARASGARFCPRCLAEADGRWALSWHLNWTFACTRHRVVLAARCGPAAEAPGRVRTGLIICWTVAAAAMPARTLAWPEAGHASVQLAADRLPRAGLSARHPVLQSQLWIDRILAACLDSDRPMTMAGLSVPRGRRLAAVATLIRIRPPGGRPGRAGRSWPVGGPARASACPPWI